MSNDRKEGSFESNKREEGSFENNEMEEGSLKSNERKEGSPLESGPSSRFLGQPATGTRRVAGTTHTESGRR